MNTQTSEKKGGSWLTTSDAAQRMNISESTVRELCRRGVLQNAYQGYKSGPWLIPENSVQEWIGQFANDRETWQQRYKHYFSKIAFITIFTILLALVSSIADWSTAKRQVQEWWWLIEPPTPVVDETETLILIATFHNTEGVTTTNVHDEIYRAIKTTAQDLRLTNLVITVDPRAIASNDRERAVSIGKQSNASMIIWGEDTGVRVTVNYLNLKNPQFDAASVEISETEHTQFANPEAYARFITSDMPSEVSFLALFALGQSHYINGNYDKSITVIEKAIYSLSEGNRPLEGISEAYFRLGWLYQVSTANYSQTITYYNKAILYDSDMFTAYNNRGIAHQAMGNIQNAFNDYNSAIKLEPTFSLAFSNRGNARFATSDLEGAIVDHTKAIELVPDLGLAYFNRAKVLLAQNKWAEAIADCNIAIEHYPNLSEAYFIRGNAFYQQRDFESALLDFNEAIEFDPYFAQVYSNRGVLFAVQGDLEVAYLDINRAIELNPDLADAYTNRGNILSNRGEYEKAIADHTIAININPELAMAYNNRCWDLYQLGRFEEALSDCDTAYGLQPKNVDILDSRAFVYKALGNTEQAIAHFEQILEITNDPGMIQRVHDNLTELLNDK